jgi:hypothetical protein
MNSRLNTCLIRREQYGLSTRQAVRSENKRLERKKVEKYLSKCLERMFGDVCPIKRNTGYPFVWHN